MVNPIPKPDETTFDFEFADDSYLFSIPNETERKCLLRYLWKYRNNETIYDMMMRWLFDVHISSQTFKNLEFPKTSRKQYYKIQDDNFRNVVFGRLQIFFEYPELWRKVRTFYL